MLTALSELVATVVTIYSFFLGGIQPLIVFKTIVAQSRMNIKDQIELLRRRMDGKSVHSSSSSASNSTTTGISTCIYSSQVFTPGNIMIIALHIKLSLRN